MGGDERGGGQRGWGRGGGIEGRRRRRENQAKKGSAQTNDKWHGKDAIKRERENTEMKTRTKETSN